MEALQEDGSAAQVGAEQPDGPVATPPPRQKLLVLGLNVGKADLEDSGWAVQRLHGQHDRAVPVSGLAVETKLPAGLLSTFVLWSRRVPEAMLRAILLFIPLTVLGTAVGGIPQRAQALPPQGCGTNLAAPEIQAAINLMPPPPDYRPWSHDPRSIEGNYDPCAALSVALITVEAATNTSPQEGLFFHNGQYVGPTTPRPYGSTLLNASRTTDDTVVLDYKTPGVCNACAPGAAITNVGDQWHSVRYKWQSDNVQRLDLMPPSTSWSAIKLRHQASTSIVPPAIAGESPVFPSSTGTKKLLIWCFFQTRTGTNDEPGGDDLTEVNQQSRPESHLGSEALVASRRFVVLIQTTYKSLK
jgi:hypothetical protein